MIVNKSTLNYESMHFYKENMFCGFLVMEKVITLKVKRSNCASSHADRVFDPRRHS